MTTTTHNFLQRMEEKRSGTNGGRQELDINLPPSPDRASGGGATAERGHHVQFTHVKSERTMSDGVELPDWWSGRCVPGGSAVRESKIGHYDSRFALAEINHAVQAEENLQHMWWPSFFGIPSSTGNQLNVAQEKHGLVFDGISKTRNVLSVDREEGEVGTRYGCSLKVGVGGRTDSDLKSTIPRSKHCATEQRRRSKINDRFKILRDLIPQSDLKRDKASFLSEVIEYIHLLQEKVQKYESEYLGCNHGNTDTLPWVKLLFRSFWEHSQKKSHLLPEGVANPSQCLKKTPTPVGFVLSASNAVPSTSATMDTNQIQEQHGNSKSRFTNQATKLSAPSYSENMVNHCPQTHHLRTANATGGDVVGHPEVKTEEGMVRISSAYSQGLVDSLTMALQSGGVDMSRASISVQINLKGTKRSNPMIEDPPPYVNHANVQSRVGNAGAEARNHAKKRRKAANS